MALPSQLPVELWVVIFGFVDPELLPLLSQVCSLWRTLSFEQPAFWEHIYIESLSRSILGWTGLRMQAARMRPCNLSIVIESRESLVAPLLNLIAQELYHIRTLNIVIDASYFPALCDVVERPAQCLESFSLTLLDDGPPSVNELSTRIFGGVSGNLRRVQLFGVLWPISGIPAFASVEAATLAYPRSVMVPFPNHISTLFPRLRRLRIAAGILAVSEPLTEDLVRCLGSLDHLDLDLRAAGYPPILQNLPIAQISEIVLNYPYEDSVAAVLHSLPGELALDVVHEMSANGYPGHLILARSLSTGQRRWIGAFGTESCHVLSPLHNQHIAARVQHLCVGTEVWAGVAPYISNCSAISRLILLLEGVEDVVRLPFQLIYFPAVKTLRLKTERPRAAVQPVDLTCFADAMSADRLHLELERVTVVGGYAQLHDRFCGISII